MINLESTLCNRMESSLYEILLPLPTLTLARWAIMPVEESYSSFLISIINWRVEL